jgi:Zn-finger nucleic acid-binding protein
MNCPRGCPSQLTMTERQGVEIDYCPTCRGVWLDRGELDKVLERAASFEAQRPAAAAGAPPIPQEPLARQRRPDDRDDDDDWRDDDPRRRRRRKGFLGELFDF